MIVVPDSDIILIKSPLKLDNYNQITFSNAAAQETYFSGLPHLEYDGCTYQRKDGVIRYATGDNLRFEDLLHYNYCMYKNDSYEDKWFYAFITDIKYINDGMSEVTIETDVFQTWQFNLNYMNSFIEREHVSDDTIGLHTIPEGLETGEFTNHDDKTKFGVGTCHAVVCTTEDPFRQTGNYPYNEVNSIPSGLHYFVVGDFDSINFIGWLTSWASSKSDLSLIQSIFMVPDSMTGYDPRPSSSYWSYALNDGAQHNAPYHKLTTIFPVNGGPINMGDTTITKPYNNIDGYIPRNNKLFVYPYNFMIVDNHGGVCEEFRYEDFTAANCVFTTKGDITPGCSIRTIPRNYKHIDYNYSEGINALKLPIGSWQGDVYTNWLTQNSVNLGVNLATSTAGIVSGVATGNVASGVSGILGIASTLGSVYEHSRIPNQVYGNQNSGDVTFSDGESTFTAYKRTIKSEYARAIDSYFDAYGYKVNRLATPNIHKRSNWDYIKCIDVNLEGDIPETDLDKIRSLFNNGCTFWHNTSTFLNYSASNGII